MRTHRSTELGLRAIAGAFLLSLVSFTLPYLWDVVLSSAPATSSSSTLHTFWIPLTADLVTAGIVALGLVGFVSLWQGRWELGPEVATHEGLAVLALVLALAAYAAYALTGVLLGFVSGVAFLRPWHSVFLFLGALFLGIALYGIVGYLPVGGSRPAAAVALALGVVGSALLLIASPAVRRPGLLRLDGAGVALTISSSVLWLVLCIWDSRRLRGLYPPAPPASAVRGD